MSFSLLSVPVCALKGGINSALFMEFTWWVMKDYPPFVYSPADSSGCPGGVPVFIFHSVERGRFEEQLRFLAENGYYTASSEEFYDYISGKNPLPRRTVLITFDDSDRTLYDTAYPLLLKYGMKAVCFICPGLISREKRGKTASPFTVLEEVFEMEESGTVDFQSHTLKHERIFTGGRIVDFINPGSFKEKLGLSIPFVGDAGGWQRLSSFGAPVYESGPRMGEKPRYYDDEELRKKCEDYVAGRGGARFFEQRNWRGRLYRFAVRESRESDGGCFETEAQRRRAILRSLSESKEILEKMLGKKVFHLAYPWGGGSETSVEISGKAGYLTNFWGPLKRHRIPRLAMHPFYVPRLKDDYIFRLPGKGRKPLFEIFLYKAARRKRRDDIY